MIPISSLLGRAFVYCALLASSAGAIPQNVTVDDAVLIGDVVPQYLPSSSSWNQGNNCTNCLVKPDPSQAYNGTWHDSTFHPDSTVSQAIEFTFTGSALYIFFILANTVPNTATLTAVNFYLDQVAAGTFVHSPSTGTDYQYNVSVYANDSITFGQHSMMVEPVSSGNQVLVLFDYLVYTTDTDYTTTSSSVLPSATDLPSDSPSPDPSPSSQSNTAAIAGGAVGGGVALVLVLASGCYLMRKRRKGNRLSLEESEAVLASPVPFRELTPLASENTSLQVHQMESTSGHMSRSKGAKAPMRLQPPSISLAVSIDPPSTTSLIGDSNGLREQVELLRDEVSRLHHLNERNGTFVDFGPEAPPQYSDERSGDAR